MKYQIHHFHRNRAEQRFIAENQSGQIAVAIAKMDSEWANYRHDSAGSVGEDYLALANLDQVKTQLQCHVFGHDHKHRARIHLGSRRNAALVPNE